MESELEQEEELAREKAEESDRVEAETQAAEIEILEGEALAVAAGAIRTTTRHSSRAR
jgi:hypothetical protein